jgi:hypothetical protein
MKDGRSVILSGTGELILFASVKSALSVIAFRTKILALV